MQLKAKRRVILRSKSKGEVEFSTVESESPTYGNEVTQHAVEEGQDVSDHIRANADTFSISGIIVGDNAQSKLEKLQQFRKEGLLLEYIGRNKVSDVVIQGFSTEHTKDISNGFSFTLDLIQVRIASSKTVQIKLPAAQWVTNTGVQQPAGTVTPAPEVYTIARGDTLWALSRRWGCTIEAIMAANPYIKDRNLIYTGKTLVVPK